MIAYTSPPADEFHYYTDGPNGGAIGCDTTASSWRRVLFLAGGPFYEDDRLPSEVECVIQGKPPTPDGGWRIGDEVVVRECCYAGPQWLYVVYCLIAGDPHGVSFGPVGRIAYGQRMY